MRALLVGSLAWLTVGCASPSHGPAASPGGPRAPASREKTVTPSAGSNASARAKEATPLKGQDAQASVVLSYLPLSASAAALAAVESSESSSELAERLSLQLGLSVSGPDFGELTRRSGARASEKHLTIESLGSLSSKDPASSRERSESFLIDYSEPDFDEPVRLLKERFGASPTWQNVVDFVSSYVAEKSYTRGFDIASTVARTRTGDCSEHAVLTTALLRRFGIASRVVLGIALIGIKGEGTRVLAVGHAWSEAFDGQTWQIADAALHPGSQEAGANAALGLPEDQRVMWAYVPLSLLTNEGAGFSRGLADAFDIFQIETLSVDARK